ncbi:MAG: peptidoglycan editing factor PgeF [Pseudomarimonas sp.]
MKSSEPPFLRAEWPAPAGVHAVTTLRRGGDIGVSSSPFDEFNLGARCGDGPANVAANRIALTTILDLPAPPLWLNQVHGTAVHRATIEPQQGSPRSAGRRDALGRTKSIAPCGAPTKAAGDEPVADAAVTADAGTVLAILTADCLPVLFCASDGSELAAAHAGWRGLAAGVLQSTLDAMRTPNHHIMAWLGPAAGPLAYEVGEEVRAAFVDSDATATSAFVATRQGHWLCDLPALARRRLQAAGVNDIYGGQHCTIRDSQQFFSHRRDGRSGRMASLIWIDT